jgi:hypothetical protein
MLRKHPEREGQIENMIGQLYTDPVLVLLILENYILK